MEPIRYARVGRGMVAYQVLGDGPFDMVCVPGLVNHIEAAWEEPALARHYRRLASFCRLIVMDRRGAGLSDRLDPGARLTIEDRAEEIGAVITAAGCDRPAVFATADGSPVAIFFAATNPRALRALVLYAPSARYVAAPDYPIGWPPEQFVDMDPVFERRWGNDEEPLTIRRLAPSLVGDSRWYRSVARMERLAASPHAAAALWKSHIETDVRDLLGTIQSPTLVLHATGDQLFPVAHGRYVADHVPTARFVELAGTDHLYWAQLGDDVADEIEEFLTGVRGAHETDRALATVLFTDLVASTQQADELGDRRWHDLLDTHDAIVRRDLALFGGRPIKSLGDGLLAEFAAPGRAVRCAISLRDALAEAGLAIRAGIHTGEVERRGTDLAGLAIHVAARVEGAAEPGEVLVSRTVRDLLAGAGFVWIDRGVHVLKGIPDEWQLYGAELPSPVAAD